MSEPEAQKSKSLLARVDRGTKSTLNRHSKDLTAERIYVDVSRALGRIFRFIAAFVPFGDELFGKISTKKRAKKRTASRAKSIRRSIGI